MPVSLRSSSFAFALAAVLASGLTASAQSLPGDPPTFTRDIAPLVYRHCATCHRQGGSAPFPLITYEDVRARARQVVEAVTSRTMPPWKASSGAGGFAGDRRLSDRDVALFERWAEQGGRQGLQTDLPPTPVWGDGWALGTPDLVLQLEAPYRLAPAGADRLRNVVLPVRIDRTRYVRAWELRTSSPAAVHHATMVVDPSGSAARLDRQDTEVGYEGLIPLSAQSPEGYFLGWTPGQAPYESAPEIAWRLDPGSDLVAMLHLRSTGAWESVGVSIALYFADRPPATPPVMIRLNRQDLDIPAGVKRYVVSDAYTLPVDVELHAVQPHTHNLARTVRADARLPDGTVVSLIEIGQWDFHWQDVYRFTRPVRLPAGTQLSMQIAFDNSAGNRANPHTPPRRVIFGQRSDDEMADVWLQVVPAIATDRPRLVADLRRKLVPQHMDGYRRMIEADPANASLHDDLALLAIEAGDVPLAVAEFTASLRLHPERAAAHYNVGNVLLLGRRAAEAEPYFREALRLDPGYGLAHQGLGLALASTSRVDEGALELSRAVILMPASPDARYNLGVLRQAQGRDDDALAEYAGVLGLNPAHADAAYAAGLIHLRRGHAPAAAGSFRQALVSRPGWSPALTELAWTLAVADSDVREPKEALDLARRASASATQPDARTSDVLAAALAANGLFDDAVAAVSAALRLLPENSDQRPAMERRLQSYRERNPFYADLR